MSDFPSRAEDSDLLARCQRLLDHEFRQPALLRGALTHASGADHRLASNERLEFLGDAVLGAVVCSWLYNEYPGWLEGGLTRVKSVVVSRRTCAKIARHLHLDDFLVLGKGMGPAAQTPDSVLAAVFEALIGALYIDGGMPAAQAFIERHLANEIAMAADDQAGENHKSHLQQSAQRLFGETPTYLLLDEKGPDHSKCFKISAQIGTRQYPAAWGPNKKDAEQRAARNALSELAGEPPPFPAD